MQYNNVRARAFNSNPFRSIITLRAKRSVPPVRVWPKNGVQECVNNESDTCVARTETVVHGGLPVAFACMCTRAYAALCVMLGLSCVCVPSWLIIVAGVGLAAVN